MFNNNNGRVRNVDCPPQEYDYDYNGFTNEMHHNLPLEQDYGYQYNDYHDPYYNNPINQVLTDTNNSATYPNTNPDQQIQPAQVNRVATAPSPIINATYNDNVHLTMNHGATVNLLQEHAAIRLGLNVTPASQSANQADGASQLDIVGEVRTTFFRNDVPLYFEGLVVRNLASDVLCGMPFLIENDITVRAKRHEIWIGDDIKFKFQQ